MTIMHDSIFQARGVARVHPGKTHDTECASGDVLMETLRAEIAGVLDDYFEGLYHSDTTRLRRVFHRRNGRHALR